MDNIYLTDSIRSFQSAYISALNDAYGNIVIPTTGINNIVVTSSITDVYTRMIPINADKTIYFAARGFIVTIDKYLKRSVVQIEPDDCDIDCVKGLVFNNNIYRKLPCLERILPKDTSVIKLTNMCFTDIADVIYKAESTPILSSGSDLVDYIKNILLNEMPTSCGLDTWAPEFIYDSTYEEYVDYFGWFDPCIMYKKVGEYNGYGWG